MEPERSVTQLTLIAEGLGLRAALLPLSCQPALLAGGVYRLPSALTAAPVREWFGGLEV